MFAFFSVLRSNGIQRIVQEMFAYLGISLFFPVLEMKNGGEYNSGIHRTFYDNNNIIVLDFKPQFGFYSIY